MHIMHTTFKQEVYKIAEDMLYDQIFSDKKSVYPLSMKEWEHKLYYKIISLALYSTNHNITEAAKALGLQRTTLVMMIRKFKLDKETSIEFYREEYYEDMECKSCGKFFLRLKVNKKMVYCESCSKRGMRGKK